MLAVLAFLKLNVPNRAPGLALGTMPAESREETHPTLAIQRGMGKEGTTSKLPLLQDGSLAQSPPE